MQSETAYKAKHDLLGSAAALLCAIHCLVLPVFFTTLPLLGMELIENVWLELLIIAVSLLAGGFAIYRGYRFYHHRKHIVVLFATGIACMVAGNFLHGALPEIILKSGGTLLLIISHIANWKKSHAASCRQQPKL